MAIAEPCCERCAGIPDAMIASLSESVTFPYPIPDGLTGMERRAYRPLRAAAPHVVHHDVLAQALWGTRAGATPEADERGIRVVISRLRVKLEPETIIHVEKGVGYRMVAIRGELS